MIEEELEHRRRIVKSIPVNALDIDLIQDGLCRLSREFILDTDRDFIDAIDECRTRLVKAWFGDDGKKN